MLRIPLSLLIGSKHDIDVLINDIPGIKYLFYSYMEEVIIPPRQPQREKERAEKGFLEVHNHSDASRLITRPDPGEDRTSFTMKTVKIYAQEYA